MYYIVCKDYIYVYNYMFILILIYFNLIVIDYLLYFILKLSSLLQSEHIHLFHLHVDASLIFNVCILLVAACANSRPDVCFVADGCNSWRSLQR